MGLGHVRRRLLKAFLDRDYPLCKKIATTQGTIVDGEGGVLVMLAMQRAGSAALSPKGEWKRIDQWDIALTAMVTSTATFDQVMRLAEDEAQRCFTNFCWGARLVNLGRKDEAKSLFKNCVDVKIECDGKTLAQAELRSLSDWT